MLDAATLGEVTAVLPDDFTLETNYPNPFNPSTTIRYGLAGEAQVRLAVYDLLGREVAVLVDGPQQAGWHTAVFEASNLPSGTYLARLEAGNLVRTQRMTLLK